MLADLDGLNAHQVSDLVHDEAGWRLVDVGDEITYEAAQLANGRFGDDRSPETQHDV